MKMKHLSVFLCLMLVVSACNNDKKEAEARLMEAQRFYEQNDWPAAKEVLDSLKAYYPKQVKSLRKALALMRTIELKEQERNFFYCDSLLTVRLEEAGALSGKFVLEKDEEYQDIGQWISKKQPLERNIERSYLRSQVNETGEFALVSVFFGKKAISHNSLKISANDGSFVETATIARDGGNNFSFTDNDNVSEIVTYLTERDGGATAFIVQRPKDRIKVEYKSDGKTRYTAYLAEGDRKAITETFEYAAVLSDIECLRRELEKAKNRIEYLKVKLSENVKENEE